MERIAIIYWSGTGNTETMAKAMYDALNEKKLDVSLYNVNDISAQNALEYNKLMLGCPSMGAEVLEEYEFEPFFTEIESGLAGKKVSLFGSYGWGDGEWMREWQARVEKTGASLYDEGLIINDTPDQEGINACKSNALKFSEF